MTARAAVAAADTGTAGVQVRAAFPGDRGLIYLIDSTEMKTMVAAQARPGKVDYYAKFCPLLFISIQLYTYSPYPPTRHIPLMYERTRIDEVTQDNKSLRQAHIPSATARSQGARSQRTFPAHVPRAHVPSARSQRTFPGRTFPAHVPRAHVPSARSQFPGRPQGSPLPSRASAGEAFHFVFQFVTAARSLPCRVATISAIIASAISSGEVAPMFKPTGP